MITETIKSFDRLIKEKIKRDKLMVEIANIIMLIGMILLVVGGILVILSNLILILSK